MKQKPMSLFGQEPDPPPTPKSSEPPKPPPIVRVDRDGDALPTFDPSKMTDAMKLPPRPVPPAPVVVAPIPMLPSPALPEPMPTLPPPSGEAAPEMHQTALVFLDDPLARKLAVAWASCRGRFASDDEWTAAAGLQYSTDAKRLCKALKVNGICRDGGITDTLALQYIARIVAAPLMKQDNKKGAK